MIKWTAYRIYKEIIIQNHWSVIFSYLCFQCYVHSDYLSTCYVTWPAWKCKHVTDFFAVELEERKEKRKENFLWEINQLFWILCSFEYLLGQVAVAILLEVTIESQWTILKSFELSGKSLPQVLNMQSPHLHSFGVIKYHFLSFVLLIVACQKIAYVERW